MKHFRRFEVFFIFFLLINAVFSQTVDPENRDLLIERIEDLFESEDAQIDLTEIVDAIEELKQNPVHINSNNPDELSRLFFLDEIKIHKIIRYTSSYGALVSINELYGIEGLTTEEADLIALFISLDQAPVVYKTKLKDVFTHGKQQIIGRYQRVLQEQRGYMVDSIAKTLKYAGNPDKYYLRYRFKYRDQVSFGLTAEKDAGEDFFKGSNPYGFDFYSLHFYLNNKNSFLQKLVVGDYHLTFGQGLTMWSTYAFGKSSDGVSIKRNGTGIKPNTSANETEFFRGAAATIKIKRHFITGFVSYLKKDGSFTENENLGIDHLSAFSTDGMHRTENEISKERIEPMSVYGIHYEWRAYNLKIGATGFGTHLKYPLTRDNYPYNYYAFSGTSLGNVGVDFVWIYRNFEFFGEGAYSSEGGFAGICGIRAHLVSRFEASLSAHYYGENYINFFSNAFGINSHNNNEIGIYAGISAIISSKFTMSGYAETFKFPYMKYQIYAPTRGNDYSLQLDYNPNRRIHMYLRYRNGYREYGYSGNVTKKTYSRLKNNIRWQGDFSASKNILLKTRIEYAITKTGERRNGFLMYQDVGYQTSNQRFSSSFRYAWFNTDSYDERIYAYENDLLYVFSVPAYYYKGNRIYLMCSYRITDKITAWLRVSNTFYSDKETIGSGGEEIYGNQRTDVKAQIVIKI